MDAHEFYHDDGNAVRSNRIPAMSADPPCGDAAMIGRRAFLRSVARAGVLWLGIGPMMPAPADSYPSHPVRWVVPYTAGGATDVLSRLICQRLSERLGQSLKTSRAPAAISAPRPSSARRRTDI